MAQEKIHDAASGFHDIKPLPSYVPQAIESSTLAVLFLAIALGLLAWSLLKRSPVEKPLPPGPAPKEEAKHRLDALAEQLQRREADLRSCATELSFIVRNYLQRVFNFPAVDQTSQEVVEAMPQYLKKALPQIPRERLDILLTTLRHSLRSCERITFADSVEAHEDSERGELELRLREVSQLIETLEELLRREAQRTDSVIEQGKRKGASR